MTALDPRADCNSSRAFFNASSCVTAQAMRSFTCLTNCSLPAGARLFLGVGRPSAMRPRYANLLAPVKAGRVILLIRHGFVALATQTESLRFSMTRIIRS